VLAQQAAQPVGPHTNAEQPAFKLVRPRWMTIKDEKDVSILISAFAASFAAFGLFLNYRQIKLKRKSDEASFIINYVSKIYTDAELRDSFYTLVDNYDNDLFEQVDAIAVAQSLGKRARSEGRPIFEPFLRLQGDRKEGERLYHPTCFQGSPEERRLDAVLGYFDAIGHFHAMKQVSIDLLAQYLNYHLMMLAGRKVIKLYFRITSASEYMSGPDRKMAGNPQIPYFYARKLLLLFRKFNKDHERRIEKERKELDELMSRMDSSMGVEIDRGDVSTEAQGLNAGGNGKMD
jgi:hypothetical protein